MFPIFISTNDEDGAIWGLISAVALIIYLIYSAFTFVQCQVYNVKLNYQNEKVEELAHRIWHKKYAVEEITVSDEDQSSYPKLPVFYDVSLVVWSKRLKVVQENGKYAFKGMFQDTDYQYYTLMGEGFNPFYSSQWNKELIQPPLVKEIQDEKSKEVYAVPLKSTHLVFSKGRIKEIKDVEDFQQTITSKEFTNNDNY
ncbi:hypothetical protein ABVR74_06035 [Lactococcus lactis subsp. lactis]|uniref:hypothetical protein n=1 Tax=Lactococcus lactis TaxID=1358 RepID=UPI00338D47BB